ncbi:hypothetical protein EPUL_004207, partial [Erysiphe pulchra]
MSTTVKKRKRNSEGLAASGNKLCKVTQTSMASFLTKSSEKEVGKIAWQERGQGCQQPNTLLVGTYVPSCDQDDQSTGTKKRRTKVAAFDFDSTLIITKSGKVHASNAQDWKWWHSSVPEKLKKLYRDDGFYIAIISNQAGLSIKSDSAPKSKLSLFKTKVSDVLGHLDIPITIYAATEKDLYRKPRTGIWLELLKDYDLDNSTENLNLEESIFVGDAAGRQSLGNRPKDFSCSDRDFAENVGIKFATPEEYFLGEKQRPFSRKFEPSTYFQESESQGLFSIVKNWSKVNPDLVPEVFTRKNKQDIILLCGSPGAGKSSWYWKNLDPLGYVRINQDILKTREKCIRVASQNISEGKSVAIDNTNADIEVRSKWVELSNKHDVPIRCVHLITPTEICIHNDVVRALNDNMNPEKRTILPGIAFNGYKKKFQPPNLDEGFQDIIEVPFKV